MPDPLDVLRGDDPPTAPSRAFASALRTRIADALGLPPSPGAAVSDPTSTTSTATRHLRPYLTLVGADAAIAYYGEAFGAVVVGGVFRDADGRVGHAELDIDGTGFYLADAYPEYGNVAPDPSVGHSVSLHLEVADADATMARAVAAGGTAVRPVEDQAYGARSGMLLDPFGHRWALMGPLAAPMSEQEVRDAMADQGIAFETVDLDERLERPEP
jgi:uncharacterized glyoxalase superfamily protein PhnB